MISVIEFVDKCVQLFFFVSEIIERRLRAVRFLEALLQLVEFTAIAFLVLRRRLETASELAPGFLQIEQVR